MHHRSHSQGSGAPVVIAAAALLLAGVTGFAVARHWLNIRPIRQPEDAPQKALRSGSHDRREDRMAGRAVTIARPRQEIYERWRDAERFPEFMENVIQVERGDDGRFHWTIRGPAEEQVRLVTRITEDRPAEVIAWESAEGSDVKTSGRVVFRDAPGNRGTQVDLTIAYDPPAGRLSEMAAFLLGREPALQAKRDLRRFKQLMEAGEVAVAPNLPIQNAA